MEISGDVEKGIESVKGQEGQKNLVPLHCG